MRPLVFLILAGCMPMAAAQSMDGGAEASAGSRLLGRDSLLVGKWVAVLSHDEQGQERAESFEVEYLPNGKTVFNRAALYRKFNRQQVQLGNAPLSLQDFNRLFPRVTWKTEDNRIILTFRSRLGKNDLTYFYQLKGDTLTTVNESLSGTRSKLVAVRRGE